MLGTETIFFQSTRNTTVKWYYDVTSKMSPSVVTEESIYMRLNRLPG